MKTLCLYVEKWIPSVEDEETGETITSSHYERHLISIQLDTILKLDTDLYNKIKMLTSDGKITEYEDVKEIYFR